MFKKVLAGIASVALALGMVAITTTPAAATPQLKVVVCKYVGTPGVNESFQKTITVNGNAVGHAWDGVTFPYAFSDAHDHSVAIGFEGTTATCPAAQGAPPADPTPYKLVAWAMPSWIDSMTPSWQQHYFTSIDLATKDLNALDGQLTGCGTQYQVDLYNDSAITASLILGGVMYDAYNPAEDFPAPEGWYKTYKLVHTPPCDAGAAASVTTQATCEASGAVTFTIANATWDTAEDQTPGEHTRTATAVAGHTFPGGSTTLPVTYTVPGQLAVDGPDCYNPTPVKPSFSAIPKCGVNGSIDLASANANSATTHIHYALTSGDGLSGLNTVTATAIDGYTLQGQASWQIDLGHYTDCIEPKASSSLGSCQVIDDGSSSKTLDVTLDNTGSTISVYFTVSGVGSQWLAAGATAHVLIPVGTAGDGGWTVLAGLDSILEIPAVLAFEGCTSVGIIGDPTAAPEVCGERGLSGGSIWVDRLEGLRYTITGGPSSVNIVIDGVGSAPYLDGTVPLAPGDYTVVASALPGYVLNPVPPASWPLTVGAPESDCPVIAPLLSCELNDDGDLTLPDLPHVHWIVDGNPVSGGYLVHLGLADTHITAVADDGYAFGLGDVTSWTIGLGLEGDCIDFPTLADWPTNLSDPVPTCTEGAPAQSVTAGFVQGVSFFSEVNYYLDGILVATPTFTVTPGSHVVTASPKDPDDGLDGQSVWEFDVAPNSTSCGDLTTLALTGTGTNVVGWAGAGYFLLISGLSLIAMRTVRRRRNANVK